VLDQVAEGDRVTTRFAVTGAKRGRRLQLEGTTLSRLCDGRIVEDWSVFDTLELLRRLGLRRTLLVAPACCARFATGGSAAFRRADGGSHRAEFGGLPAGVLKRRAGVGIDQLAARDVGVGPLDQQARVLAFEQRPGNSACPQIDPLAGVL
jgi:hypothetical protein